MANLKDMFQLWEDEMLAIVTEEQETEKDKFISYVVQAVEQVKNGMLSPHEIRQQMDNILNEYGNMVEKL